MSDKKIAIILIRGLIGIKKEIKDTLHMLRLRKKLSCAVVEATPSNLGMIKKVKDYVTWGEIDDATLKLLLDKRGKVDPKDPKKLKPYFNMHPPKGGFERKGIKIPFNIGGALGYRGPEINKLIQKMLK